MTDKFIGQDADLYDYEKAKIDKEIMPELARRFYYKEASQHNLEEMTKWITDQFLKMGLIIHVNTAEAYLGVGPPKVSVVSRLSGHSDSKYGHDHERKRKEVVESRELGEKYRGEKSKHDG